MPRLARHRRAAAEAAPGLLLSAAIFAASTQAIIVARASSTASIPLVADFALVRGAVTSPTALIIAAICAGAIALGVARSSHVVPALGQLCCTAIVYFRVMGIWMGPVSGLVDTRLLAAIMWLYMPQSLAIACFVAHAAVAFRRSRERR